MATTNFQSGTVIASAWLNDVNGVTYNKTFPDGTIALSTAPGSLIDATAVSYEEGTTGSGAVARTVAAKLKETISVLDFGAVADFNPTTGTGTDNFTAISNAITYAQSLPNGCTIVFPPGNYFTGNGYMVASAGGGNYNIIVQFLIGSRTTANAANNINLIGYSASLYQGNTTYGQGTVGRMFDIANANNTTISGFNFYGNMGGTMSLFRATAQYAISVELSSFNTRIENNYFTNFPAWAINISGDLANPTTTTYVPQNVSIIGNTIKQRYGNGIPASTTGSGSTYPNTGSLWCIAAIEADGLFIQNNILIGKVDLETNSSQLMNNINIQGNQFLSGWVTPIASPASSVATYWADEATNPVNTGSQIAQGVQYNGSTTVSGDICNIISNTFELGTIYFYGNTSSGFRCNVTDNYFKQGTMNIGWNRSGTPQVTNYSNVANNICGQVIGSANAFINLDGYIQYCNFNNNVVLNDPSNKQVISNSTYYGGDTACTYYNNRSLTGQFVSLGASGTGTATRTVSINLIGGQTPFNIDVNVSANAFASNGSAYSKIAVGGIMGSTSLYSATKLVDFTNGSVSISAITKQANYFSFTVTNTSGTAGYLNVDVSGTSIPLIQIF